jgi:cytochrome c
MLYLPASKVAGIAAGLIASALAAGVAIELVDERRDQWARAVAATGGDPERGRLMFIQYGCGSCHVLEHVPKATGLVGPPLDGIAVRAMIAGKLSNTPDNLAGWIRDPQTVTPGTAMPDLDVGRRDARDITAFLYTRAD